MAGVQDLHPGRAAHEEEVALRIQREPPGADLTALRQPGRRDLPHPHVDGHGAVLVLQVGVDQAASVIHGEALR